MGGELVRQAYAASFAADQQGNGLTMNERGALLYVCSTAHDSDKPPKFWGGRDSVARYALGRVLPDREDTSLEAARARRSIYESVRKALDGLVARGLLQRVGIAHPGRSQEYFVLVDKWLMESLTMQPEIGSSATGDWAMSNVTLQMTQPGIGPETHNTHTQERNPHHLERAPHLLPVEKNGEAA